MPTFTAIVGGFVNNIVAASQIATTTSEHFVHALLDHGCVVPVILGMYSVWSITENELAESLFFHIEN
jgi:hypothetical protein